jgi:hypothetical protein
MNQEEIMSGQGFDTPKEKPKERAPTWYLVIGWIFAILGGLIGIAIAAIIAFDDRYDDVSHKRGKPMLITSIVLTVFYLATCIVRVVYSL